MKLFFLPAEFSGGGPRLEHGDNFSLVIFVNIYDKGGDGIKLYLDGELKGEHAYNAESFEDWAFPHTWYLGKANWGDPLFPGIIDEFRSYNRALSENEIRQNMDAESLVAVSPDERLAGTWGEIKKK